LADHFQIPLLVEADGSRMRPLKTPGEHEPAIPAFANQVVVVAGLAALGKPLTPDWVHRPDRFAALTGLEIGQAITSEAVARALAQSLIPTFSAVLVASLGQQGDIFACYERVAGILLAAGKSSRYGEPKQLLDWRGEPLVRRVARTALQAGLSPVVVVTGAHAGRVGQALAGLEVQIVHNPDWEQGQSASLRAGLSALPAETGAAIFLLADQPQVPAGLIEALVSAHAASLAPVISPSVEGRRANPVLFDRVTFNELRSLHGDSGGRQLMAPVGPYPVSRVPWDDPRLLLDVDTPEDYQRLLGSGLDQA
jgi:molybdenum cofactor cytidylyltransferase